MQVQPPRKNIMDPDQNKQFFFIEKFMICKSVPSDRECGPKYNQCYKGKCESKLFRFKEFLF